MNSLKQLYKDIKTSWGKKFRWITAFFLLWIYRTIFMPAGDGGFAQALQIISLFSMLFIVYSHWQRKVVGIFRISNPPIRTLLLLYFYALLSATWAFMPAFSAFLSIQNFILMALTFWLLSMPKTFDGVEKSLVYLIMAMAFFSAIGGRYNVGWPIFIHLLQTGTCSAMCFAYCFAEWIKGKKRQETPEVFQNGHADKFRIACYEYIKRCQCILCRRHRHSHAVQRSCHVGSFNGMYWHFCIYLPRPTYGLIVAHHAR